MTSDDICRECGGHLIDGPDMARCVCYPHHGADVEDIVEDEQRPLPAKDRMRLLRIRAELVNMARRNGANIISVLGYGWQNVKAGPISVQYGHMSDRENPTSDDREIDDVMHMWWR
jgi:hypothetical protein